MALKTEHAARFKDPGKYKEFRRVNNEFGDGIDVIYGVTEEGRQEVQAVRFATEHFSPEAARAWLKHYDYRPSHFELANPHHGKDDKSGD